MLAVRRSSSRGRHLQNLQVLREDRECRITAELRLQKYAAKAKVNARTFARDEDRLRTCLDSGSEAGSAIEGSEKSRMPEDLPGKSLRLDSTAAGISTDARPDSAGGYDRGLEAGPARPVFAGIAEFERDLIRERTGAGREAAKQRGVRFGRPRKLNPDQVRVASQLLEEGKAVRDIARTFNVHEATIYRLR